MTIDKKNYLTKEGLSKLEREFKELKERRMEKVKEEDCEEEVDFIDRRLEDITQILKSYELIQLPPKNKRDYVDLGATILVETGGRERELMIVGTFEADPMIGKVSNESPVGRALIGKTVGDAVLIHSNTEVVYTIKKVTYDSKEKIREA